MSKFLKVIFGDPSKKVMADLARDAEDINKLEPGVEKLTDDQLKAKTAEFKDRLKKGEKLDKMVFECFAVVREAAKRTLQQRHYDVQLMGGLVLYRGGIAEMRTGEGKTLTSTLALYTRALEGKGCHLVTVNDYLARRDAIWMGQVFHFLGLSVGCIQHEGGLRYDPEYLIKTEEAEEKDKERDELGIFKVDMDYLKPVERREAYTADITYGTNNEFGFDYLRDNMAPTIEHLVTRDLHFAIVDEVDSILIDEARTPLIISAPADEVNEMYVKFSQIVRGLKVDEDYNIDEKMRAATYTDQGIQKIENALGIENLYAPGVNLQYFADTALKAKALYDNDVHYVNKEGEIVIVDEFTGRMMPGRRFSEGIHQAIEAKEGVKIQRESRTLATITFQNLFRVYDVLAGMTGTAATEAEEFGKIYGLDVTEVPTNVPPARDDLRDRIFKTEFGKYKAVIKEIKERSEAGQPVLVGTASIEKNELLGSLLQKEGVAFNLLNAKNHEKEAEYIAQAGKPGAVTIATNMAGRGVDIKLGGIPASKEDEEKVKELGGLFVLGTERHESRRIDNQLRGRSGRQGDPGTTQFYLSMEDDLMRVFASDRAKKAMDILKIPEDMPIENKMISGAIEKAQTRVEGHHFDIRKHLLEYDDVLNKHREVVYKQRREVLDAFASDDKLAIKKQILDLVEGEVEQVVLFHTGEAMKVEEAEQVMVSDKEKGEKEGVIEGDWDAQEIVEVVGTVIPLDEGQKKELGKVTFEAVQDKKNIIEQRTKIIEKVMGIVKGVYKQIEERFEDRDRLHDLERAIMLRAIDTLWIDHLAAMGALRTGIGLRGYGQRDPLMEYKKESYLMYQNLLASINAEIVYTIFKGAANAIKQQQQVEQDFMQNLLSRSGIQMTGAIKNAVQKIARGGAGAASAEPKVGRNDVCPCGSGKKYKKCHGA